MDYFQGVVVDYLRADRSTFVNTEFCIELADLDGGFSGYKKGNHWFCDIVALNFKRKTMYLCEVTTAKKPSALKRRLKAWSAQWPEVRQAVLSLANLTDVVTKDWKVIPRAFVQRAQVREVQDWAELEGLAFEIVVTPLEDTAPWNYDWIRNAEHGISMVPSPTVLLPADPVPCDN